MHDAGIGWWWGIFGLVWMTLFWGGLILLAAWAFRRATGDRRSPERETPLEIAKARYARGEITREQFEQLKRDLA